MSEHMKTNITLAAIILTYNEEQNIKACIESVQFADEIVVIDSGSSDETSRIAKQCGARVIVHPMGPDGFAGQRNLAVSVIDADWLVYVDADERMTSEVADEIKQILAKNEPGAWKIKRMNIVFGQMMQYGEHGPDYVVRLFPRDSVNWVGIVHEHPESKLPVHKMQAVMHHYTYTNWNRYFIKFNQYTTMMADKMQERGKKAHLHDLIIRPWFAFFRFYILKLGFLDGKMGFVFAVFHGFYTFSKYVKLYYWQGKQVGK